MEKLDLKGVTLSQLQVFVVSNGEPGFRASQILNWLYNKRIENRVSSLENMGNISKACIQKLKPLTYITSLAVESANDSKYVFTAEDNNSLHAELKKQNLILAVQIGCSYKCKFCRFGKIKFIRNLKTGEIMDQIIKTQERTPAIEKIIFSGMGEPLANPNAVLDAVRILCGKWGLGFHFDRITISTCGAVSGIKGLIKSGMPVQLIVGFHSADDKIRSGLMPINDEYPVDILLNAVKDYGYKTGNAVELEYIMLKGVNDSYADAKLLISKLLGLPVKIKLVTYEPVPRAGFAQVNFDKQEDFLKILIAGNINAEIAQ